MKCLNCNQDNLESSNYCRKCGYFLKKEQTININEEIYNNKDLSEIFDNPIIYISVFIISIIGMILSNKDIIPSSLSFKTLTFICLTLIIATYTPTSQISTNPRKT